MRPGAVARRYARALFALAESQQALEPVGRALATIAEALAYPGALRVLTGPVSLERKRGLLKQLVEAASAPAVVRDFMLLLVDHDRIKQTPAIRSVFEQLLDQRLGIKRAMVRSAVEISPEILQDITRTFGAITGKQVVAKVEVVPELIAGVIVEIDGRVYDGSLRTQLAKLHQQMATGG
jgi:F-type H+-transporting ATPase subunit delta